MNDDIRISTDFLNVPQWYLILFVVLTLWEHLRWLVRHKYLATAVDTDVLHLDIAGCSLMRFKRFYADMVSTWRHNFWRYLSLL